MVKPIDISTTSFKAMAAEAEKSEAEVREHKASAVTTKTTGKKTRRRKTRKKTSTKEASKKKSTLADKMDRLRKQYGSEVFRTYDDDVDFPCISTGSVVVDQVIGIGGIPRGRMTEFFGWESSGKTTLALQTMGVARSMGLRCAYLDFEQSMHKDLATNLGVQFDDEDCILCQPPSMEVGDEFIHDLLKEEDPFGLIVIDSVPAMVPTKIMEMEPGETSRIGYHAAMYGAMLVRLIPKITKTNTAMIFINHARVDLKAVGTWGQKDPIRTPGGSAARFYYAVRLFLQEAGKGREKLEGGDLMGDDREVAKFNIVRVTGEKNKVGYPHKQGRVALVYGQGFDNAYSVIVVAKKKGLIKVKGSWLTYDSDDEQEFSFNIQGEVKLRRYLNENPRITDHLAERIDFVGDQTEPMIELLHHSYQDSGVAPRRRVRDIETL